LLHYVRLISFYLCLHRFHKWRVEA
jgi:hypothetical protein